MFKRNTKPIIKDKGVRYNVWHQISEKNNISKHPAVFPTQLAKDHIISWSNENDTILDPFMGSGTTLIAAKQINRNAVGIEISHEYCKIAQERLDNTTSSMFNCDYPLTKKHQ